MKRYFVIGVLGLAVTTGVACGEPSPAPELAVAATTTPTLTPIPTATPPATPTPTQTPTPTSTPTPAATPTPTETRPLASTLTPTPISFCRYNQSEIYVENADGTNRIRLTYRSADDSGPAWSPDGSKIAFHSNGEIYVMDADGSNLTRLSNVYSAVDPIWSPDGSKILFVSRRDRIHEIYVMDADGSSRTRLSELPGSVAPTWSPDGSKIAFHANSDGNPEIYVMDADGSDQTRLTTGNRVFKAIPAGITRPPGTGGWDPSTYFNSGRYTKRSEIVATAWSPDGSKILFVSTRDRNYEIYVMDADGSNQTRLSNLPGSVTPTWSPDGSKIAFERRFEIYVMDADGSNRTRLSNVYSAVDPIWSPDGSRIAFRTYNSNDIYVMDGDGSNETLLTTEGSSPAWPAWGNPWDRAAWSPDGKLASVSRVSCVRQSLLMEPLDVHVAQLASDARLRGDGIQSPQWLISSLESR